MEIAVIGINHDKASAEVREKVYFSSSNKIEAINNLLDRGIKEVVVLSTCNRSEIYIAHREKEIDNKINEVVSFLKEYSGINELEAWLFIKKGKDAMYYLYEVASGLRSIVLGEDQILGQVKDDHTMSMEVGGSKKILNKLFRESITTTKKIKNTLKISEHPLSVSYIGVKYLKEKLGSLDGKKALLVGLGKMGRLALTHLLEENLEEIYVTNRNHDKIIDIQKDFIGVTPVDFKDKYDVIKDVDILITATACPRSIIKYDDMPKLDRQLYIMDMAMPRDVDEKISNISNINLYNVDDLKKISSRNERKRNQLSCEAQKMIECGVEDFVDWLKKIKIDPVIESLNSKRNKIQGDTLEYIYRKLELDNREKKIIDKMLNSALKRVIRNPILKLKDIEDEEKVEEYIGMISYLFDLKVM